MGHIHLHVRDIDEAVNFYHGILGFDLMGVAKSFRMGFVSAGGYHHHIGLNTWQGEGRLHRPLMRWDCATSRLSCQIKSRWMKSSRALIKQAFHPIRIMDCWSMTLSKWRDPDPAPRLELTSSSHR